MDSDSPSTPAAPRLAFTNCHARMTSFLEIQYGFASCMHSSPSGLIYSRSWSVRPLRSTRITEFRHYCEPIRPCAPHWYSDPHGVFPVGLSLGIGAPDSRLAALCLWRIWIAGRDSQHTKKHSAHSTLY